MPEKEQEPSAKMLEHLSVLMDMDLLAGEKDWQMIRDLKAAKHMPGAGGEGKAHADQGEGDDD